MASTNGIAAVDGRWPHLDVLRSKTIPQVQAAAVSGMLRRLVGDRYSEFIISVQPSLGPPDRDTYKLESGKGPCIRVTGSSGVAAALGVHNYLKQWCGCQIAWSGNQLNLPSPLPSIAHPVQVTTQDRFRYYQNVCTASYSYAWWQWPRWEQEIDWMALNGINLSLAFTGQEAIWWRVYKALGLSDEQLQDFFAGPAFSAWQRMGNVDSWGGPLSRKFANDQLALQHRILERMREFGIIPVLPAFNGHVPKAIEQKYKRVNVTSFPSWSRFLSDSKLCSVFLLNPSDSIFQFIADSFMTEMRKEFGLDHVYNCDTFNENTPLSKPGKAGLDYIQAWGVAVYAGMTHIDPDAIWIIQGWMLLFDSFWKPPRAKALLTSVPLGRMIVLDLQAELNPMHSKHDTFYGQPFIWCMLHNFGGVSGLYGAIENLNTLPFQARSFADSTMIGVGLTMEGIEQNEVIYEFMNEIGWRSEPVNLKEWVADYSFRRYGDKQESATEAWTVLQSTVYNCKNGHNHFGSYLVTSRPSIDMWWPRLWYDKRDLLDAWDNMLLASFDLNQSSLYRYDLTDITREVLQILCNQFYVILKRGVIHKNVADVELGGSKIVEILSDMEILLASDDHFLLGHWLESAKALGKTKEAKKLLEYNARYQITLWGPLIGYASKQWSGLFQNYYIPRWQLFIEQLKNSLNSDTPFQQKEFDKLVLEEIEEPFTMSQTVFPTVSIGNTITIANDLHTKWRDFLMHGDVQVIDYSVDKQEKKQKQKLRCCIM